LAPGVSVDVDFFELPLQPKATSTQLKSTHVGSVILLPIACSRPEFEKLVSEGCRKSLKNIETHRESPSRLL